MRKKGRIRSWNDQKGFGFIEPSEGGKQVFIHITAFSNRNRQPENDEVVSYALSTDKQGRPCASNATLAGDRLPVRVKSSHKAVPVFCAILFLCAVGILVAKSKLPPLILGLYLIASLITFLVYAVDKSAAKLGTWRTSEGTLQWLSLLGGWPGALIAQQILRHKSKKRSFRAVFRIMVFLNVSALVWMATPEGQGTVQSLLGENHTLLSPGQRATIEWANPR